MTRSFQGHEGERLRLAADALGLNEDTDGGCAGWCVRDVRFAPATQSLLLSMGGRQGACNVEIRPADANAPAYLRTRHLGLSYRGTPDLVLVQGLLSRLGQHLSSVTFGELSQRLALDTRAMAPLPPLTCYAPWTSLAMIGEAQAPVPCAASWMSQDGLSPDEGTMGAAAAPPALNAGVSLQNAWNGPLFRALRAEMRKGPASDRCRSSCRVVLGARPRGYDLLTLDDAELLPPVVANRRRLIEELHAGQTVLQAAPLELVVGVSARCNITCGFCEGPPAGTTDLNEVRLQQITAWLPTLITLCVTGQGEPLMSRSFHRLLQHVVDQRYTSLKVSLTSNGILVRPSWLKRYAHVNWGMVRFSINAGSAATHARTTGINVWSRLIENIEAVCTLRRNRPVPFTFVLSCVLSRHILGDLANYAALAHRYGAEVCVEPMTGNLRGLSPFLDETTCTQLLAECREVAAAYADRNAQIAESFRRVADYTERRLRNRDFAPLPCG